MISIGIIGFFIASYLIYYINELIEFNNEEQKAYLKLKKILNPINKEYKASNLIKVCIFMKKMLDDCKNIENDYISKRKKKLREIHSIIQHFFNKENIYINHNLKIMNDINQFNEKKKFIYYLIRKFIVKIKLISECNNFKNNLLIARNFSYSFNHLLKTLKYKMNDNLNQLNNKLQILTENSKKYKNIIKCQKTIIKKIKKVKEYQDYIIMYLINTNNKNKIEKYLNTIKMIKKAKSLAKTDLHNYKNNMISRFKNIKCDYCKNKEKNGSNRYKSIPQRNFNFGRMLKNKAIDKKEKRNKTITKSKSFKDNILHIKKSLLFEFINIKVIKKRKNSYNFTTNEIINKY